jgi:hypothetical protein
MKESNYFDRSLGHIDDITMLESLKLANKNTKQNMNVRAKFTCSSVIDTPYSTGSKTVHLHAVYGTEGENATFSKYTPSGNLSMQIDKDTPAVEFFVQGKSYYLNFETAE